MKNDEKVLKRWEKRKREDKKDKKQMKKKKAGIKAGKWQFDKHTETMSNEKSENKNLIGF